MTKPQFGGLGKSFNPLQSCVSSPMKWRVMLPPPAPSSSDEELNRIFYVKHSA